MFAVARCWMLLMFCFFKQKTAYELRISDWSSDVCSSDLDENDGLFDHVPPPVPPTGTPGEFVGGLPIGGGFRVPCIVISPWTAGGWVCSEPLDQTSILRFLEAFTGVREPNITDWRRRTFGDMTRAFRFGDRPAPPPGLPDTRGSPHPPARQRVGE